LMRRRGGEHPLPPGLPGSATPPVARVDGRAKTPVPSRAFFPRLDRSTKHRNGKRAVASYGPDGGVADGQRLAARSSTALRIRPRGR
jgi:hypothetical protein